MSTDSISTKYQWLDKEYAGIKQKVAEGKTYTAIAHAMAKQGVKTPKGSPIRVQDISAFMLSRGIRKGPEIQAPRKARAKDHEAPKGSRKDQAKAELLACEILQRKDVPRDLKKRLVNTILDGYANDF